MTGMAPRLPQLARTAATGLALATLAALALSAPGAQAATVQVTEAEPGRGGSGVEAHVLFFDAQDEKNDVSLTGEAATNPTSTPTTEQRWTIQDNGAPLTAGTGCQQVDANTAVCTASFPDLPLVALGTGDDEFTSDTAAVVDGGDGDDTIRFTGDAGERGSVARGEAGDDLIDGALAKQLRADGGEGGDLLIGSVGNDQLSGGPGTDELRGGNGNDRLKGNGGPDTFTCGQGGDTVTLDSSDRLLETIECETLELPAGHTRVARISIANDGVRVAGDLLTLGVRTGPRRSYDLQLRDATGRLLGTGTLRTKVIRIRLTTAGLGLLKPGARETVFLLTRPAGTQSAGPKTRPGVQLDLTIGS